jgi:hypothetical protein
MADFLTEIIRRFTPKPNAVPPARFDHWNLNPPDIARDAQAFDIALYRVHSKENFLGNIISHITSSPYEHAATVLGGGYVIAADAGGIGYDDLYFGDNVIDLFRLNRLITLDEQAILQAKSKEALGRPYNYWNLINFPYLNEEQAMQYAGGTSFICSELVAWKFKAINVEFVANKEIAKEAPADLGLSDILNYIGTYDHGKKLEGNFRNQFIGDYQNVLATFVADFMGLFTKVDEYYAEIEKNKLLLVGKD